MLAFPSPLYYNMPAPAGMMELVDVVDSKSTTFWPASELENPCNSYVF